MAKSKSYLDNLQKELGQWKAAARGAVGPKGVKSNSQDSYKKALGQFGGAILGHQYDDKTGRRTR